MIGRDFYKRLRLLNGRSENITTRFNFNSTGRLVEHVTVETHDRLKFSDTQGRPRRSQAPHGS